MDKKEQKAVLEAVLFTMGEAVEIERLAAVLEISKKETKELLLEMKADYDKKDKGITLMELEDSFQMCTKSEMYEYLIKIAKTPRKYVLTDTLLETLSIIAYKQPITRAEIERVRGVSCDHAVNRLVEFGLIAEVGRMDAPGKPLLVRYNRRVFKKLWREVLRGIAGIIRCPDRRIQTAGRGRSGR